MNIQQDRDIDINYSNGSKDDEKDDENINW